LGRILPRIYNAGDFMEKLLDINKTIYELVKNDPDIKEIMANIGFDKIVDANMLNTVGRMMTIKKGAKMKGIDLERIKDEFIKHGYKIIE